MTGVIPGMPKNARLTVSVDDIISGYFYSGDFANQCDGAGLNGWFQRTGAANSYSTTLPIFEDNDLVGDN